MGLLVTTTPILNTLNRLAGAEDNDSAGDAQLNLDSPACRRWLAKEITKQVNEYIKRLDSKADHA